jgi:heat shock protein HslJ
MKRGLVLLAAALVGVEGAAAAAPSLDELANATYSGVEEGPVTLSDGAWEGEPFVAGGASRPRVTLVPDFRLAGDLDGDGSEDAAVLLTESSGGSGSVVYLAVVGRRGGVLVNLGTALVGDRVQVRAGRVANGQVGLEVVQAGPNDAACCPSQLAVRRFNLADGKLTEEAPEMVGTLSLAGLRGSEWVLREFARGDPAPAEPEITLAFTDDGVTGSSGCNRYFGSPKAADSPGDLVFGPLGGTRKACPEPAMQLEQRYLKALGSVRKFGFAGGKLALTYRDGDSVATLLFAPKP